MHGVRSLHRIPVDDHLAAVDCCLAVPGPAQHSPGLPLTETVVHTRRPRRPAPRPASTVSCTAQSAQSGNRLAVGGGIRADQEPVSRRVPQCIGEVFRPLGEAPAHEVCAADTGEWSRRPDGCSAPGGAPPLTSGPSAEGTTPPQPPSGRRHRGPGSSPREISASGDGKWGRSPRTGVTHERWRWDLNPRKGCPFTRFRGVRPRPLGDSTAGEHTRRSGQTTTRRLATFGEKPSEHGEAFVSEHAADHLGYRGEPLITDNIPQGADRARPRVRRAEHQPAQPGGRDSPGAHGARLKGHDQRQPVEAPSAGHASRRPDGLEFGVRRRVVAPPRAGSARARRWSRHRRGRPRLPAHPRSRPRLPPRRALPASRARTTPRSR